MKSATAVSNNLNQPATSTKGRRLTKVAGLPRGPWAAPPFRLHQGDAVEWLRSLPSGSFDLIVTDPPYESLEKHRSIGTTTRLKHSKSSSNDWFTIFPNARFEELFQELWRVLAKNAHLYLFCDAETMFVAKPIAERAGFRFWKPLVWDKKKIGMGYHYRSRCEFILFFEKGKRKLSNLSIPDVIEAPRIFNGYPTEKPVDVSRILIEQSTAPGEWVADPFMGSGSVGRAAIGAGRGFLGNDLSAKSVEVTRERLVAAGGDELLEGAGSTASLCGLESALAPPTELKRRAHHLA